MLAGGVLGVKWSAGFGTEWFTFQYGFHLTCCHIGLHLPPSPQTVSAVSNIIVLSVSRVNTIFFSREGETNFLTVWGGEPLKKVYWSISAHAQLLSYVWLFATPWTIAHQAPLSMGFPRQNTGVDCHFLLQGLKYIVDLQCYIKISAVLQSDSVIYI